MGMTGRIRVAVDLDEVAGDTVAKRLQRYRRDYGVDLTLEEIAGKQIRDAVPAERKVAVEEILDEPDFSVDIPVMKNAREVLESMSGRFDIIIATSAMDHPPSLHARYIWLQRNFPFISDRNYIFCGSKKYVSADYLIDDNPMNLEIFSGKGLLFDAHHNISVTGACRVKNWLEVQEYFRSV